MVNKIICVTGGAGYLGSWIVKTLLERGYDVRATVRSIKSAPHLTKESLAPNARGALALYEADLLIPNSYDKAIQGSDVVIHCASPFLIKSALSNPEKDLLEPAVQGVRNVFASIINAESVKHVVMTSSIAAITVAPSKTKTFDENDWALDANIYDTPYQLSKFMAEDTAWQIARGQQRWTLTTICPAFILGPTLSSRVNDGSITTAKDLLSGQYYLSPKFSMSYVDVRDVAECHMRAFERGSVTAGQRYLCCAETLYLKELGHLLNEEYGKKYLLPKYELPSIFFKAMPFLLPFRFRMIDKLLGTSYKCSNKKIKRDLDMQFTPINKSINDMADSLVKFKLVK